MGFVVYQAGSLAFLLLLLLLLTVVVGREIQGGVENLTYVDDIYANASI